MKTLYLLLLTLLIAVGCEKRPADWIPADRSIRLSAQYTNGEGAEEILDEVKSLTIIACADDKVVWVERFADENLSKAYVNSEFAYRGTMYAVANDELIVNMSRVSVGQNESILTELYTSNAQTAADNGLIAMIDTYVLNTEELAAPININLKRNVARFDIVATTQLITPQSVAVVGLPLKGSLIEGVGNISTEIDTLNITFESPTPASTIEGAFYCHPFDEASGFTPTIEVTALFGGTPVKCYLNPAKALRNTYYRVLLREFEGQMVAELVADGEMEKGDDDSVLPNEGVNTKIDIAQSLCDPSAIIDPDGSGISFSYKGGVATIALTGSVAKTLIGMDGSSSNFTVTEENGKFKLTVAPNKNMRPTQQGVVLKFAAVGETDPEKYARITVVMRNYSPVEVITMAGVDWTIVNAQGRDPLSYLLISGAKPIARELFAADWGKWGGVGEQWGPRAGKNGNGIIIRHPYWEHTMTAGHEGENGPIVGDVTMWDKHDYCPDGFRAPTREEFARIWPPAKMQVDAANVGPFSYTTPSGTFTVKYEKIGQNSLVISDGTNELIFPLMGMRGNSMHYNGDGPPSDWAQLARDVGRNVYYWAADRDAKKNPTVFGYVANQIYNWTVPIPYVVNRQEMGGPWNADAHCTTRCVRPAQ